MRYRHFALAFLGLAQGLCAHAHVREDVDQLLALSLEDVLATKVMISTHTRQTLSKAPSVVSLITAEDIKATGATNLTDILQSVPGIYIKANLFGFRPLVSFRGAAGTHTLLMVNGVPMRDLVWSSGIFWRGLPTSMIERVEIIRGPGSALFGSDASAGVINVITKTAGKMRHSEAGARTGSFNSQAAWVQHQASWNDMDVGFTAELSRTDGHNPFIAADGQSARDRTFGTRVSYAPGYAQYGYDNQDVRFSLAQGNWRLLLDYMSHRNAEIGLTGAAVLDPLTQGKDSRLNLQLLYSNEEFARHWKLNGEVRYSQLDYSSGNGFQENPAGFKDATGSYPAGFINQQKAAERMMVFEASGLYSGLPGHALRLGGGFSLDDLYAVEHFVNKGTGPNGTPLPAGGPLVNLSDSPWAFAPKKPRRIGHLFLQDVWSLGTDWELTAGARYDHYSDFGGTLNPRLALVWQSTDRLSTKLLYGQAFRAPSYLELYSLTAANKPNPALKPERSETWDLSFSYLAAKDLKLGLGFFQFAQSNLIAADATTTFQNRGNNTSRGVELEAMWQAMKNLRISGNFSHREDASATFNSIPTQKAYLRTDWAFLPNWNWNMQANWIGGISLPTGDPRAPLTAHTLVDTTLRYTPRPNWELVASLRNLFDVDAREYSSATLTSNLPLPRRSAYAEVRLRY